MKFVLLGDDPACLPLLRAIARASQHELAAAAHAGQLDTLLAETAPQARRLADWRELLVEPNVTAAIVAGFAPEILEGARALARAGTTLVVFPDVRQTAGFAYDLWPMDDEGRVRLIPVFRHDASGTAE